MDRNSYLPRASRISSKKKDLLTSRKDAKPAVPPVRTMADPSVKCSMPFAHPAGDPARFLFSRGMIARYIAAIAIPNKDNYGSLKCALWAHFLYAPKIKNSRPYECQLYALCALCGPVKPSSFQIAFCVQILSRKASSRIATDVL